ncbi:MAG: RNA-binding domain-containing protein [Anaerolineae bacterium]
MTRSRRKRDGQNGKDKLEWRRIDLHLHTPASKDYQEPGVSYLDILRTAEAQGLDIIAFTDHNSVAGYAAMMQEIADLERWDSAGRLRPEEKERLEEYRRLHSEVLVLPGLEFTATFGFHVLAVFDPQVPIRALEHVLLTLNVPPYVLDVGETEVGATSDVLTAYRVLAEAGALVIAAHANSSHGVAMFGIDFGGQTKIAYTQDPNLHALEVTDLETTKRRTTASFFNGSKPQYPRRMHCIQGSDAHRLHGVPGSRNALGIGDRSTEVMLMDVSFQALKELFLGSEFARTRPYRHTEEQFDYVEAARQEGPTIVQSFHEQSTRVGGRMHAIVRDAVAFANTNGGTIYVGANPNAKVPVVGVDKPEEAIETIRSEMQRLVTPPIDVSFSTTQSKGKQVVRITVPRGADIPYVIDGSKIYIRQEAETTMAMRDEIVALIRKAFGSAPSPAPVAVPELVQEAVVEASAVVVEPPGMAGPELHPESLPQEEVVSQPSDSLAPAPRTGVEIIESAERKGVMYHTMRDLRNSDEVHNVSRNSARRLWRYAIALRENHTFEETKVTWEGNLGLWHRYLRSGRPYYDLVQKGEDGQVHIYYGVTEDGIHGPWKQVVGEE